MRVSLRVRLSAMFFLQFTVPGAWVTVLWPYLVGAPEAGGAGFSDAQAALAYGIFGLATLVGPLVGGQVADRWVPTQWFLATAYTVSGVALLVAATQTSFGVFVALWAVYAVLAGAATPLTNSLCFHHLRDVERQFGGVRVFGTLGFIAAGFGLSAWRWVVTSGGGAPVRADCVALAGLCSLAMGIFCTCLPHTPPHQSGARRWALMEVAALCRRASFRNFVLLVFVAAIGFQFYYVATSEFLERGLGVAREYVPGVMTTGQIAEVFSTLLLFPVLLPLLGVRRALVLGAFAWALRFLIFACHTWVGMWVVVGSLALHGIGFPFFFLVSQLYANRAAPPDARGSAQALMVVVFGVGSFAGTQLTGRVLSFFSHTATIDGVSQVVRHWSWVFLIPCAIAAACAVAFLVFFDDADDAEDGKSQTPNPK